MALVYPDTKCEDLVEDFHGVKVADPYRWLEDPDSPATRAWVDEQVALTDRVLSTCELRDRINERFTQVFSYDKFTPPFAKGSWFFVFKQSQLQNQPVLWVAKSPEALYTDQARVLLDLNTEYPEGTTSFAGYGVSDDGSLFAYGLSSKGSDWQTVRVRQVETGKELPDVVNWVKFSIPSWLPDNKGFFYSRYPETDSKDAGTEVHASHGQRVHVHLLGTDSATDPLVWEDPSQPEWTAGAFMSTCGKFAFVMISEGCLPANKLFYAHVQEDMDWHAVRWIKLVDNFDAEYEYLGNDDRTLYLRTNKDAPKYRIVALELPEAGSEAESSRAALDALPLRELVPESAHVLQQAQMAAGNQLVTLYLEHVEARIIARPLDNLTATQIIPLPAPGAVQSMFADRKVDYVFLKFMSFLYPGCILGVNFRNVAASGDGLSLKVLAQSVVPGFDASQFETIKEFSVTKDGTRVPYFLTRAKTTTTAAPCLLYGYGGFNVNNVPSFSPFVLIWLKELGGVYVSASIRGGGEYGTSWRDDGSVLKKQHCFDDFCGVAEHLQATGVTTREQLAIFGGSNGGLLTLACMTQRPDLFSCILSLVPVVDMLRFHKFTIGHAWKTDYGCADNEEQFHALIKYSPLHNVRVPGQDGALPYPACMIATGDHDDRVSPLHSYKMTAMLQAAAAKSSVQVAPLVVRIDVAAGHGSGKPTSKVLAERADLFAFAAKYTGATWHEDTA